MATNSVLTPFPVFTDLAGQPLENGYIYIGMDGFEARSNPKASFFDVAKTIPTGTASGAAIRTRGGLPINNSNAPAMFYVDGDYSISVCDKNGVLLYSALSPTLALNEGGVIGPVLAPDGNFGAVGLGFLDAPNTGFVRNGSGAIQTVVNGVLVSQQTSTGVTFSQPIVFSQPVSGAGFDAGVLSLAQPLDADLTALAALTGTGIAVRTADDTWALRQITSSDNSVTITNPGGVAGNINLSVGATTKTTFVTTSGTQLDVTGVPAGTNWFRVMFDRFSMTGPTMTDNLFLRLGTSASVPTTGYSGGGAWLQSAASGTSFSTAFGLRLNGIPSSRLLSGIVEIRRRDGNKWVCSGTLSNDGPEILFTGGAITMAAEVTRLRILRSGSTDTFNNGEITVEYGV
jgi:hypothetical protein